MNSNIGYFQRKIELGDFNKIFHLLVWEVCFQILNSHLDGSFGNSPQPLKPSVLKLKKVTKQKRKERGLKKNKEAIKKYGDRSEIPDDDDDEDEDDFPIVPAAHLNLADIFELTEKLLKCDFRGRYYECIAGSEDPGGVRILRQKSFARFCGPLLRG